jgi:precorrin-6B methylase 2
LLREGLNVMEPWGRLYVREDSRLFCYDVRLKSDRQSAEPRRIELPLLASSAAGLSATKDSANDPRRIVNSAYSPTPHDVVAKMLALAGVKKDDVVFDLGSGDGRILIAAARDHKCKAIGYEADPNLVELSRRKAQESGVADRVTIHKADLFTADLSQADVVALYLLPVQNKRLIPQLKRLRAGSRIVSHHFEIPGAEPDKVIEVESEESGESHRLYLFTSPLKAK